MKHVLLSVLSAAVVLFWFSSCQSVFALPRCPYAVSGAVMKNGACDGVCQTAGIYLTFYNTSALETESVTLSFRLYDSDGESPLTGSNCITAEYTEPVAAGEYAEAVISLDGVISFVPEEPYVVDYLYVSKIVYSDGTEWQDPYGLYVQ